MEIKDHKELHVCFRNLGKSQHTASTHPPTHPPLPQLSLGPTAQNHQLLRGLHPPCCSDTSTTRSNALGYMRDAALAVTTLACVVVAWHSKPFNWMRQSRSETRRSRKRVSFSEADNTVIHDSVEDLSREERKALCWSPAELRGFARSTQIDGWIEDWGS